MNIEDKIKIYLKAGLQKEKLMEKIEKDLTDDNREKITTLIETHYLEKEKKIHNQIIIGVLLIFITASILFAVIYMVFIIDSSFTSSSCNEPIKVSIEGATEYRTQIIKALELIENNCDYLYFIEDNTNTIQAHNTGFFRSGYYTSSEQNTIHIDSFSDSTYGVAFIIIHETCHSYQYKHGREMYESDCTLTAYNFLKNIGAPKEELDKIEQVGDFLPWYKIEGEDIFLIWKQNKGT